MTAVSYLLQSVWLRMVLVAVVAAFFVVAAVGKIQDPLAFAASISHYRLITFPLTYLVALVLPWVELWSAVALLWQQTRKGAALLLLVLLAAFQIALASAWIRGLDIDCGCLGSFDNTQVHGALARNLVLISFILVIYCYPILRRRYS